jgi:hypothetical protein
MSVKTANIASPPINFDLKVILLFFLFSFIFPLLQTLCCYFIKRHTFHL